MFLRPQGSFNRVIQFSTYSDMHINNSRPDLIDSALLRPGRLDKSLFCGMPDFDERKDVRRASMTSFPSLSGVFSARF